MGMQQELNLKVSNTLLDMLRIQQNIDFSVTNRSPALTLASESRCLVKGLLLRQKNGKFVQILVPNTHIIDPELIRQHFGVEVGEVVSSEQRSWLQQQDLASMPAIPGLRGLLCLIDNSLLQYKTLYLDSGNNRHCIQLGQEDFVKLTGKACRFASFAKIVSGVGADTSVDEAQIIRSVQNFTERRTRQRLEETLDLPTLPNTAQHVIKLRADPNADISDLSEIIERDPSLAAQVVSWASSPYYSAPGKIRSVHDAIVRVLGFDMVMNMALGLSLDRGLSMRALAHTDVRTYWRNAMLNATLSERLAHCAGPSSNIGVGLAYLSGLLHNFGFLLMAEVFPVYLQQLKRFHCCNPHLNQTTIELHTLGLCNNQLASWLFENWSMPKEVVRAVRYQNCPHYDGEFCHYAQLIRASSLLLKNLEEVPSLEDCNELEVLLPKLDIHEDTAREQLEKVREAAPELLEASSLPSQREK